MKGGREDVIVLTDEPEPPYDRTAVSKQVLADGTAPPALYPADLEGFVRSDVTVTAIDRDAHRLMTSDGPLPYGTLLLAPGAAPRIPPVPGLVPPAVHVLRDAADGRRLRAALRPGTQLLIVGGGLIGLEVAAAARALDVAVTVVEVAERPMARVLPAVLTDPLVAAHREAGTVIETGVRPERFEPASPGGGHLVLADGRSLAADVVLVATGVAPRTELAAAAGLAVDDGIVVDPTLTTSDPAILAAGDAARVRGADGRMLPRTEAWTPALAMGQHAARTILGEPGAYTEVPWAWSDQLGLRIQMAGDAVGDDVVLRGDLGAPEGLLVMGLRDGRLVGAAGMSHGAGVGRVLRGAVGLIATGRPVDRDRLADPTEDLRALAAG